jgi:hypothetical protein
MRNGAMNTVSLLFRVDEHRPMRNGAMNTWYRQSAQTLLFRVDEHRPMTNGVLPEIATDVPEKV